MKFKKFSAAIVGCAALLATACNKNASYADALKHIETNYTKSGEIVATAKDEWDYSATTGDVYIMLVKSIAEITELKGSKTSQTTHEYMNKTVFVSTLPNEKAAKEAGMQFQIKGKRLIMFVDMNNTVKQGDKTITYTMKSTMEYDDIGRPSIEKHEIKNFHHYELGDGKASGVYTTTYTYND